ncbi:MAG TPA: DUF4230 domain-containing protein [Polyangiaceae bacterium]|jgi:hypothetical protein|nr:DUF4230 domain-containing protein [Polyangiaceae bacterium]
MKSTLARSLVAIAAAACVALAFFLGRCSGPEPADRASAPAVVMAVRDLARLEATSFHIEKVVEVTEAQSRLWGLVDAKDQVLLVAVGDVVAGVDLAKLRDEDVQMDAANRTIRLRLPPAQVLSAALDERATHVVARSTDMLAHRNEQLEGAARGTAEEQMRQAAIDAGILEHAKESSDRTLRALLRSLGYEHVDIDWTDRG